MLRLSSVFALALLPFAAAPAPVAAAAPAAGPGCPNLFPRETVIVYDVLGSVWTGFQSRQLVVYSDGSARICDTSSSGPADGRARFASVPPSELNGLMSQLTAQGAFQLCDSPLVTPVEVPFHTLMIQQPGTDSMSRNASWFITAGAHADVQRTLERFIAHAFPGF